MAKQDAIKVTGTVMEALGSGNYRVELDKTGTTILCHLSGKMRQHFIKVLPGDVVEVEMSPYDMTRGRINTRLKLKK